MKNKNIIITGWVLVVLAVVGFLYFQKDRTNIEYIPLGSSTTTEEVSEVVSTIGKGILKGNVTVGPVCTKEIREKFPTYPCTPTPEMYAAAQVFVYMPDKKTLVKTIVPDKYGNFSVTLTEGTYFIDMTHQTMGGTKGVPTTITISKDKPVVLKLDVDTGLR